MQKIIARSGTFTDNMKLPVHRWFRYSAGFSAEWVQSEIIRFQEETGNKAIVLDPFTGSGTTNIAADALDVESYGLEGHPFVSRVAQTKQFWFVDIQEYQEAINDTLNFAISNKKNTLRYDESNLLGKCYTIDSLSKLDNLKIAHEQLSSNTPVWDLVHFTITSILRACSHVGTAQWQYILPNKSKSKVVDPFDAFLAKSRIISEDMLFAKENNWKQRSIITQHDARNEFDIKKCNLLISSPPYPNNYDYADATRLEMMFWQEISGWSDLKNVVRPTLMRSCSQHSASDKVILEAVIEDPLLDPIRDEIYQVTKELEIIRHTKGGKKSYHTMIAAYFLDLAKVWVNVRKNMSINSSICYVIGDSAPYGIYVPAEKWLGELALSAGFNSVHFEKLRDRNIKWKNRTHTVPLHEGRLWIKG
ncbi:site-specific DNA-methyltransferase [Yersinia enterocolitica]|uniref:site-specific DNA-methyltransferase n=2 Tax=Yersinia enterocolitica TaxID=630 RepID=UPI001D0FD63E|nr:site-specific DNA-methyltransferase [Yersinia enterocolitica]HEI6927590.1 hypothetical protein [Yersinia enterocolitica]